MGHWFLEGNVMDNIRQLGDFRRFWSSSSEYPNENYGNDHIHMPVDVIYEWGNGKSKIEFSSEFRAYIGSGPNDGDVNIDDTEKVRIEDFHLSFKAAFQKYEYDDDEKSLIISGSSLKMGGSYKIWVRPTILEP